MRPCSAAVALVEYWHPPVRQVLLLQRAVRKGDPWSGHWALPGGRRELSDPNLLYTAQRETLEECGIELQNADWVHALPPASAGASLPDPIWVAPHYFRLLHRPALFLDAAEVAGARWVDVAFLRDAQNHSLQPLVPGATLPGIFLGPGYLWGFTYRVVLDWCAGARTENQGP